MVSSRYRKKTGELIAWDNGGMSRTLIEKISRIDTLEACNLRLFALKFGRTPGLKAYRRILYWSRRARFPAGPCERAMNQPAYVLNP